MNNEWLVAGTLFFGGLYALYYFLKTFVNSTVEKSIAHQFDLKLETFKQNFIKELHAIDRIDKYRLAALDKRLEAHQHAFTLAKLMSSLLSSPSAERDELSKTCKKFWFENNLYLSNDVRKQFWSSFLFFNTYLQELQYNESLKGVDEDERHNSKKEMKEEIKILRNLPSLIENAVNLEAISNEEKVSKEENNK